MKRKIAAVEAGLKLHASHLNDPLEVLRRFGGREMAAICGAILAARLQRIPVILDGYVVTEGTEIGERAVDACDISQKSVAKEDRSHLRATHAD